MHDMTQSISVYVNWYCMTFIGYDFTRYDSIYVLLSTLMGMYRKVHVVYIDSRYIVNIATKFKCPIFYSVTYFLQLQMKANMTNLYSIYII